MNNIMSTILEMINLLKIIEPSLRNEEKHVMLVDFSSSKNKKRGNPFRLWEVWLRRRLKRLTQKGLASIVAKMTIRRGTARLIWSPGRNWHEMFHRLQVIMSLRLILFLMTTYGYKIPIVAHTYALICRA